MSGRRKGEKGLSQADVCSGIVLQLFPGDHDAQHHFPLTERTLEASFSGSMGYNSFLTS